MYFPTEDDIEPVLEAIAEYAALCFLVKSAEIFLKVLSQPTISDS